ncbi:hypothetical protein AVEN_154849-1 [Araneus ventricosus]|uniref:Uncharacterized protein n=1 Tax=Araneus ventricosus TaxID=182803 RepID=A0A4Y2BVI5_ARAVE|nr:hypothetical protein AVEN_154849-1 [Araneus ventricosus]
MHGSNTTALLRTRVQQYIRDAFQQQVIGYGGCVEWPPRSPDLNPLDFFCGDTSNSEYMQPLHQHCRNFEIVLRMLLPACHLPCCTMCSGKVQSRVQICIVAEGHHFEHDRQIDEPHFRQAQFCSPRSNKCAFCAFHLYHFCAQDVCFVL